MHSFITTTAPDLPQSQNTHHVHPETSIGIDEVREIQHFLSRKAVVGINTVIIHQAHLLTLPAQNALLKTLEEPPVGSQIFLVTDFPEQLLSTVLSRCQQIISPNHSNQYEILNLDQLLKPTAISDKLKYIDAQEFDRISALKFLDNLEFTLHSQIQSHQKPNISYEAISQTRKYLKANCNVRLSMDLFAMHINTN